VRRSFQAGVEGLSDEHFNLMLPASEEGLANPMTFGVQSASSTFMFSEKRVSNPVRRNNAFEVIGSTFKTFSAARCAPAHRSRHQMS
jgi:hypothetical protein